MCKEIIMLSSYPKVYQLGHAAISELLCDEVLIQEKIDGSQISFGIVDGKLQVRSHHCEIDPHGHYEGMFDTAIKTILNLEGDLEPGYIYRGEYLRTPKHNTLCYEDVPKQHIILFDISTGLEKYASYEELCEEASSLDLEVVPLYSAGNLTDFQQLEEYLKRESCLGGTTVEGVVIKNYSRYGRDKHVLMGKYVSEKFKEMNGATHKKIGSKEIMTVLGEQYRAEARWEKAIQHLEEQGQLTNEPKDIGPLIKEINIDVLEECADEIKEKLFKWAWGSISKKITSGFPEYYKKRLAEAQFQKDV